MARGGDGGNERTIFDIGRTRSGGLIRRRTASPQPSPIGGGSGVVLPPVVPPDGRPVPGSVLNGELAPLLGGGTGGSTFLRRLFRKPNQ